MTQPSSYQRSEGGLRHSPLLSYDMDWSQPYGSHQHNIETASLLGDAVNLPLPNLADLLHTDHTTSYDSSYDAPTLELAPLSPILEQMRASNQLHKDIDNESLHILSHSDEKRSPPSQHRPSEQRYSHSQSNQQPQQPPQPQQQQHHQRSAVQQAELQQPYIAQIVDDQQQPPRTVQHQHYAQQQASIQPRPYVASVVHPQQDPSHPSYHQQLQAATQHYLNQHRYNPPNAQPQPPPYQPLLRAKSSPGRRVRAVDVQLPLPARLQHMQHQEEIYSPAEPLPQTDQLRDGVTSHHHLQPEERPQQQQQQQQQFHATPKPSPPVVASVAYLSPHNAVDAFENSTCVVDCPTCHRKFDGSSQTAMNNFYTHVGLCYIAANQQVAADTRAVAKQLVPTDNDIKACIAELDDEQRLQIMSTLHTLLQDSRTEKSSNGSSGSRSSHNSLTSSTQSGSHASNSSEIVELVPPYHSTAPQQHHRSPRQLSYHVENRQAHSDNYQAVDMRAVMQHTQRAIIQHSPKLRHVQPTPANTVTALLVDPHPAYSRWTPSPAVPFTPDTVTSSNHSSEYQPPDSADRGDSPSNYNRHNPLPLPSSRARQIPQQAQPVTTANVSAYKHHSVPNVVVASLVDEPPHVQQSSHRQQHHRPSLVRLPSSGSMQSTGTPSTALQALTLQSSMTPMQLPIPQPGQHQQSPLPSPLNRQQQCSPMFSHQRRQSFHNPSLTPRASSIAAGKRTRHQSGVDADDSSLVVRATVVDPASHTPVMASLHSSTLPIAIPIRSSVNNSREPTPVAETQTLNSRHQSPGPHAWHPPPPTASTPTALQMAQQQRSQNFEFELPAPPSHLQHGHHSRAASAVSRLQTPSSLPTSIPPWQMSSRPTSGAVSPSPRKKRNGSLEIFNFQLGDPQQVTTY